ncbi:MAG TPA: ribbon-helix-helix protein, CopG family [Streptosporangiaceae bacterium]|nr:ribbon-helix-helix protein, CopG family [Streptosporangiaceae bacterium]
MYVKRAPLDESVTLRFPQPMARQLDAEAERLGHTRSSLLRQIVREHLANAR